jgi:hypothetical protein
MSLSLRKIQRTNPLDRAQTAWYLIQNSKGYVDTDQI